MKLKIFLSFILHIFAIGYSEAFAAPIALNIEPIVGYEQVQQILPTPHSVTRLMYGARVTAGVLLLSGEGQYTHATSQETYPAMTQVSTGDRLQLGVRSGFNLLSFLSFHLRAGLQASQDVYTQTDSAGVTTLVYNPVTYAPYAGTGVRVWLSSKISASADIVAVIPNINDLSQNSYQATAGFALKLP